MKWLLSLVLVLLAVATPISVGAQQTDDVWLERALNEPSLQVEIDATGSDAAPSVPRIPAHLQRRKPGHQHKHQATVVATAKLTGPELHVEKSPSGIIASSIFMGLGVGMAAIGGAIGAKADDYGAAFGAISLVGVGAIFLVGGSIGIGISSHRKREAERELRKLCHVRETPQ